MARTLKAFCVNFDGRRERLVAAKSMTEAARLIGLPYSHFRNYGSETGNKEEIARALSEPRMLWEKSYKMGSQWEAKPIEVLTPTPRTPDGDGS